MRKRMNPNNINKGRISESPTIKSKKLENNAILDRKTLINENTTLDEATIKARAFPWVARYC